MLKAVILSALCVIVNIPFGYLRQGERKLSFKWFLYIHLPIPLVVAIRIGWHCPVWQIPFFIAFSIVGQWIGGRIRLRLAPPAPRSTG